MAREPMICTCGECDAERAFACGICGALTPWCCGAAHEHCDEHCDDCAALLEDQRTAVAALSPRDRALLVAYAVLEAG